MSNLSLAIKGLTLEILHRRARRKTVPARTLIIPASTFGSLGDLAMVEGLHVLLRERGLTPVALASYGPSDNWLTSFEFRDDMVVPDGLFGWKVWTERLSNFDRVFLNGADVLDGKYSVDFSIKRLSMIKYAARSNIPCTITGFSFNARVPDAVVQAFNEIPSSVRFCLRDPGSLQRFNERTNHQGVQVADLAFLLQPKDVSNDPGAQKIQKAAENGRLCVGLTPNLHCVSADVPPEQKRKICLEFFTRAAEELSKKHGCLIVLLPHDTRGPHADNLLCDELSARLTPIGIEHINMPSPADPAYVKGLLHHCHLAITGRMHCGIAALGTGTPVILIDYQDKVKGLENFFNMDLSVKLDADIDAALARTASVASELLADPATQREKVLQGTALAVALSQQNLPSASQPEVRAS